MGEPYNFNPIWESVLNETLFNTLADALLWVASQQGARQLYHYLDDFIVLGPPGSTECASSLHSREVVRFVGCPNSPRKDGSPTTCLVFLGIEIDTSVMQARLPRDKLAAIATLVNQWRQKRARRKKELQSLAGHLCYAAKVVRPGRRFLREMFALLAKFKNDYFFIRLNHQIRADLEWWRMFIHHWNGVSLLPKTATPRVHVVSDASGSWGAAACWDNEWFQIAWSDYPEFKEAPIAAKELLPILVAAAVWGNKWQSETVLCHCDNEAVVYAIKGDYTRQCKPKWLTCCALSFSWRQATTSTVLQNTCPGSRIDLRTLSWHGITLACLGNSLREPTKNLR